MTELISSPINVPRILVDSSLGFAVSADMRHPPHGVETIGVAIFCHGFSGAKYPSLTDGLASVGFLTLSIDFPGYGGTLPGSGRVLPSEQMHIVREFGAYAEDKLMQRAKLPIVLLGAALGGSVALHAAVGNPRFNAFVLAHPLASGEAFLRRKYPDAESWTAFWAKVDRAQRTGGKLHRTDIATLTTGLQSYLPRDTAMEFNPEFAKEFCETAPSDAIAAVAPRRVLVIHCDGDSMITTKEVRALVDASNGNATLHLLEGGEHFIFEYPHVVRLTCDWLLAAIAPHGS